PLIEGRDGRPVGPRAHAVLGHRGPHRRPAVAVDLPVGRAASRTRVGAAREWGARAGAETGTVGEEPDAFRAAADVLEVDGRVLGERERRYAVGPFRAGGQEERTGEVAIDGLTARQVRGEEVAAVGVRGVIGDRERPVARNRAAVARIADQLELVR